MDALKPLYLPTDYFDLVNLRLAQSYVRTWEWISLLKECQRVSKPGGIIRVTEAETVSHSSSEAVVQLGSVFTRALHSGGHYFTPDADGITNHLVRLHPTPGPLPPSLRGCLDHASNSPLLASLFLETLCPSDVQTLHPRLYLRTER